MSPRGHERFLSGVVSAGAIAIGLMMTACAPFESGPGGTGGSTATATGGASTATGGAMATGGATGTGGATATGGTASGGSTAAGSGGASATGGSATGGTTAGSGGRAGAAGGTTVATGGSGNGGRAGATAAGGAGNAGGTTGGGGSALPPVTDYGAAGPFPTTSEKNTGPGGKYTIVRPTTLGQNGFLHPPIIFGPGIGMEVAGLMGLVSRFASHGFVVIGTRLDGGPGDAGNKMAMLDGLNWILQQNTTAGSMFQGKLDVKHAVSMGYSVGGTSAVEIANHEAVATTVSIHGHKAISAQHGPMLQTTGTKDTVGLPLQQYTYDNSKVQTFMGTVSNADHGYIQTTVNGVPGGVETPAIVAWMRYWIYGDTGGKKYFYGDDCVMCAAPWTNPQRKNWQ